MNEPRRWLDDPEAPRELRELLREAPRGRALDSGTRSRLGRRVLRYAAIPLSAAAWLSVKSAAALGVAAGVATASVVAVVEHTVLAPDPVPGESTKATRDKPRVPKIRGPERLQAPVVPPAPSAEPAPTSEPAHSASPPKPVGGKGQPPGLGEETQLLERARQKLASEPATALELAREHIRRFPKAQLAAERSLIEIEALYRTGHRDQARSLAEQLLAHGADDLYAERLRRLLAKIERGQ
jgi:hypothetical protein